VGLSSSLTERVQGQIVTDAEATKAGSGLATVQSGGRVRRMLAAFGCATMLTLTVAACGGGSDSNDAVASETSSDLFGADHAGGEADLPDVAGSETTVGGITTTTDASATTTVDGEEPAKATGSTGASTASTAPAAGGGGSTPAAQSPNSTAAPAGNNTPGTQAPTASSTPAASTASTQPPAGGGGGDDMTEAEVRAEFMSQLTATGMDQATAQCITNSIFEQITMAQMEAWSAEGLSEDDLPPELVIGLQQATIACMT
jgi:hypothetical protein